MHLSPLLLGLAFGMTLATTAAEPASPPRLFREPTLSQQFIVFVLGGDLWRVPRSGGEAVRLTSHPGTEQHPRFSPDGRLIAFTGEYDGNEDVFIIPTEGGVPRRLTSHPESEVVRGWTPDGRRILFASARASANDSSSLYTVSVAGGPAESVPLPVAEEGSYSPDGTQLAYVPVFNWQSAWKRYRGGQTRPIWIARLSDSSVEVIPRENSQDFSPMWVGAKIYFLSDRNGPVSLFAFDSSTKAVTQVLPNSGLDLKSASAGPGAIVFEQFGALGLFDLSTGQATTVPVTVAGDFPEVRSRYKDLTPADLENGQFSPTGQRAVFSARGEILTIPTEKGDVRNLTRTPGVMERDPAWSPDGRSIAYFSDATGEYQLHLQAQDGTGEVTRIPLGSKTGFYYAPKWSPDGTRIAYLDKDNSYWFLTVTNPSPVKIDGATYGAGIWSFGDSTALVWSPDNRWIAYTKDLPNMHRAIFLYSLPEQRSWQVTDGMADAAFPAFSEGGEYLYFATSTDAGPTLSAGDLSAINRPVTRNIYLAVLDRTRPSPLAAESDEEKGVDAKAVHPKADGAATTAGGPSTNTPAPPSDSGGKTGLVMRIDFEQLSQRILALPLPARNYQGLVPGKSNILFTLEAPALQPVDSEGPVLLSVQRFDLGKRKADRFLDGVRAFTLAANREKVLYRTRTNWFAASAESAPKEGEGQLKTQGYRQFIDPRAEWAQMYREAWRLQRDFLYDPGMHGLDLPTVQARYAPFVDGLVSRADLNYLFEEMLGEVTIGHMFVGGGTQPEVPRVSVGLLGADFELADGRYRFRRIYDGENWNPKLRAPLTEPGVAAAVGDYLLAVDGEEVRASDEVYRFFQNKADRIVTLRLGPTADGQGARDVKVTPVDNEKGLRHRAWVEDNRRTVARLSGGRLGYLHLPDTAGGGYTSFTRYYFAQQDRQGFVIDERYNHGGYIADYVVDHLRRSIMMWAMGRTGRPIPSPFGAHPGPKVMLINQFAGSGGDAMPWMFRKAGIGKLVGKRTWGGLVGIGGYPSLLDGGGVTAPHMALFGTDGQWEVENIGIPPDIEVELEPKAWREGRDSQLEKAVAVALEELERHPIPAPKIPAYPNYHRGTNR